MARQEEKSLSAISFRLTFDVEPASDACEVDRSPVSTGLSTPLNYNETLFSVEGHESGLVCLHSNVEAWQEVILTGQAQ